MATPQWNQAPAFGALLTQLVELYTRALRVDVARRAQGLERMRQLMTPPERP